MQTNPQSIQQPPKLLARTRHGQFVVLGEDMYIGLSLMYYGEFGEHEWQFMQRFLAPSQVIVDAGANLGAFAVPFAKVAGAYGHVHAFEPQPVIFECLRETIALNALDNVTLHPVCLGASNYELEINEPDYTQLGNYGGVTFQNEVCTEARFTANKIRTRCTTLDDVLKGSRVDFYKIDVEGMEIELLKGSANILARHKPVIYTENNRPERSPELVRLLQDLGYRMWWHTGPFFNPHNFAGRTDDIYGNRANINMICIPPGMDESRISPGLRRITNPDEHIFEGHEVLDCNARDIDGK